MTSFSDDEKLRRIESLRNASGQYVDTTWEKVAHLTDRRTLSADRGSLDVYEGFDHWTALSALLQDAQQAGTVLPAVVITAAGEKKTLHLHRELTDVVAHLARHENIVSSAANGLRVEYARLAGIRDDEGQSLDDRFDAARSAFKIVSDFGLLLPDAVAAYDPDALPSGLDDLRQVYGERIEAAAMRRVKEIKGAKTQQGVDVPATCLDMARALEEVSEECALGIEAVDEAADRAAAQTAYETAVASIEAVTPLNVPEWQTETTTAPAQGHEVHIRADHPQGANIAGLVRIRSYLARDANGDPVVLEGARVVRPPISPKSHVLSGRVPAGAAYPLTLTVEARNLCGPSTLTFTVDDPSA